MRALMLLAVGCSDYQIWGKEEEGPIQPFSDTGETTPPPEEDTATTVPEETGEPTAEDCSVTTEGPRSEADPTCGEVGVPSDPWSAVEKWTYGPADVITTPVVGDLDGDGVAEVVFVAGSDWGDTTADLVVADGATGAVEWSEPGRFYVGSGVAIADVDLDGEPEVLAITSTFTSRAQLVAFGPDGAEEWSASVTSAFSSPIASDLDQDGDVEVVAGSAIVNGINGSLRSTFSVTTSSPASAVDLDLDGRKEILVEGYVLTAIGAQDWTCAAGGTWGVTVPVQADADPEGEVLTVQQGLATLCDYGGSVLWERRMRDLGAPPAVADFDGDGAQEIVLADQSELVMVEADGTEVWSLAIDDLSGASGASSWDVDGDGVPEVLYADEEDLMVIDGRTGTVRIRYTPHQSVTMQERPIAADVDGDGHGEIVLASSWEAAAGITVLEAAADDWPYTRPVWNQHDYSGVDVTDALGIPAVPEAPWQSDGNQFPGQESALWQVSAKNLRVAITEVCAATCDAGAHAEIALQVWNDGGVAVEAGAVVEVSSGAGVLGTAVLGEIAAGNSEELVMETTAEMLAGGIVARVDPDGVVTECHEDDQQAVYGDVPCE